MKKATILRDELFLFKQDRSAVLKELNEASEALKTTQVEIVSEEQRLKEIRQEIAENEARLESSKGRAISLSDELFNLKQEVRQLRVSRERETAANQQEKKSHQGRIKELSKQKEKLTEDIGNLKSIYDSNSLILSMSIKEKEQEHKALVSSLTADKKELESIRKELERAKAEDKKITKDRLKREDKVRNREKLVDARELSLRKKADDVTQFAMDLNIVYARMKKLYKEVKPEVDLDKLIKPI